MGLFGTKKNVMVKADNALPGREEQMAVHDVHYVTANSLKPPFPTPNATDYGGDGLFLGC